MKDTRAAPARTIPKAFDDAADIGVRHAPIVCASARPAPPCTTGPS
ncbi:hypothetical protein [Burkholderia catarinensis]|nr:hypothetical protein [Burkholderia catarinensis]